MLRCPNCGTDNMLNAIFCRGCGQKIDLNAVKPEDFEKVEIKKNNTFMQNLIGGIIIGVLLVGFLVGLFFPSCDKIKTTAETRAAALAKFESIGMDKSSPVDVTDEDISNFVTAKLLEKVDSLTGSPRPTGATVHCLADNKVKIIATGKYCGLPISLTVEGTVQLDTSSRRISVRGEKCSVGLFPLPKGLEQSFLGPFRTNFNNVLDGINGFKALKTEDGKASLVRAKIKKPAGMPGDMMPPGGM